jgi:hypothetical protein
MDIDDLLKRVDKSKIKSIKVKWEKVLDNKAFCNIKIKLYKEGKKTTGI